MEIMINIDECGDCKHSSHSGVFTPGGAIYLCRHRDAPPEGKVDGVRDFNDIKTKEVARAIFGPRELNFDFSIASWCPLKRGSSY